MFKRSLATIALLFSGSVSANINTDFDAYLSGEKSISSDVFDQIWNQFSAQHGLDSPNSHLSLIMRKNNLANTL